MQCLAIPEHTLIKGRDEYLLTSTEQGVSEKNTASIGEKNK